MRTGLKVASYALGALLAVSAAVAFGSVVGAPSLAEYLGTSGATHTQSIGDISTAPGNPCYSIQVFGQKSVVGGVTLVAGTMTYNAWRLGNNTHVARIVYEVRDPSSSSWLPVLDVSEPDSRISNPTSGNYNSFSGSYSHQDLPNGIRYRVTVYDSGVTGTTPQLWGGGFAVQ